MISGASIDRCVRILLTTFYHMHHYTVQLLGRWSSVHIPTKLYQSQFATGIDLVARTYHLSHECHPSNFIPHKVGKFEIVSIINWITIT